MTWVLTLLSSHSNLLASLKFFSHWWCLLNFICLEIPQNFSRSEKNCIFAKDLVLKAEFLQKNLADWHDLFTQLLSHNNSHGSSKFFSHWRCLLYFICLEIPQNFSRNKKNCIFAKYLVLKAEFLSGRLTRVFTLLLSHKTRSREECYSVDNHSPEILLWYPLRKEMRPKSCYTSKSVLFRMYVDVVRTCIYRWYEKTGYSVICNVFMHCFGSFLFEAMFLSSFLVSKYLLSRNKIWN